MVSGPDRRPLHESGGQFSELGNRNCTIGRNRLAKCLVPLDFVHRLGSEV